MSGEIEFSCSHVIRKLQKMLFTPVGSTIDCIPIGQIHIRVSAVVGKD
jgi:hypothetical protein